MTLNFNGPTTILFTQGDTIMTAAEQIVTAINEAKTSLTTAVSRIEADVTELKRKAGEGEPLPPEDLAAILTNLSGLKTAIDAIDPVPEFPAAPIA